ncbi:MAG: TIGR02301 family protein, partial [Hyphomicrobiales bacterium]|nr:TIGR02301 family protein [Hyphomicrobiales bacterium]
QPKKSANKKTADEKAPAQKWLPPPYEPQLLRLSELMGALDFLERLCKTSDQSKWRGNMQQLMQIESRNPLQKARLAGAFNAGYRGYALNYRTCTDNARLVISRHLIEGEKIARDVASRYGGG